MTWTVLELSDLLSSHDSVKVAAHGEELDRQVEKAPGPV